MIKCRNIILKPWFRYDCAVLVSLNGPVDLEVETLFPMVHKPSGLPYMFIDNAKQYADPTTLFRSVVNIMLFMIKHTEDRKDPEAMGQKVSAALARAKQLQVEYQV